MNKLLLNTKKSWQQACMDGFQIDLPNVTNITYSFKSDSYIYIEPTHFVSEHNIYLWELGRGENVGGGGVFPKKIILYSETKICTFCLSMYHYIYFFSKWQKEMKINKSDVKKLQNLGVT